MSKLYEAAIGGLRAEGFTDEQICRELELDAEVIAQYPGKASPPKCGNCGLEQEPEAGQCSQCGRIFSNLAHPFDSEGPSVGAWQASVAKAAQVERANESAAKRGGDVQVHSDYMTDLRHALSGVLSPTEQLEGSE